MSFQILAEQNLVDWSPRDNIAALKMISILLLKNRDEGVLRQTAQLIVELAKSLPAEQMNKLVKQNKKVAALYFRKLSRVKTYYTQMKILLVLKTILSSLEDGGAATIRAEEAFIVGGTNAANDAVQMFDLLDIDNFIPVISILSSVKQ